MVMEREMVMDMKAVAMVMEREMVMDMKAVTTITRDLVLKTCKELALTDFSMLGK